MTTTKETKHSFDPEGNGKILTQGGLPEVIARANGKFPQADYPHMEITGTVGESGVVVSNPGGLVVAAVRHPSWIPRSLHDHGAEFGNTQGERHVERSFLTAKSDEAVQRHARFLIDGLTHCENMGEFAEFNEGAGAGGSEPEAWLIHNDGSPYPVSDGGELQANCVEETIAPVAQVGIFLQARAHQILQRKEKYPDAIIVDTSTLTTASPREVQVGESGEIGPYVQAIQHKLWKDYMHAYDPVARQLMGTIASQYGFRDWQDMHKQMGNMAYLVFAASHLSIGLPHLRLGGEAMAIPEQEAIAVADMFNTEFASLAELLMLSTPMVFNLTPRVEVKGQQYWPRDMRAILRYTLDTTYPSPFIMNSQTYRQRVTQQIIEGQSHTMDRAAYVSSLHVEGQDVQNPVMHGRVRVRATSNEPRNLSGRVEYTGCSASPSLYDEAARNSLLQLLMIAAYEALAEGANPVEYFKDRFPSLGRWEDQKDIVFEANIHGFRTPRVSALIHEGMQFAEEMGTRYPALQQQARFAHARLANLLKDPVPNLQEYLHNPQGPFCEVVQAELASGRTPLEVTKEIEKYQLALAEKILQTHTV